MNLKFSTGTTTLDVLCGISTCLLLIRLILRTKPIPKGLRLPPGPRPKPIIGNVTDWPGGLIWESFTRWTVDYGELIYVKLLGQPIIIINSVSIARDLLEKRSSIYSDRVNMPMAIDLVGWGWNFGLQRYGNVWRRHRKMFHQHFRPEAVGLYKDIQTRQTRGFLKRLHDSPDDFTYHILHLAGSIIMEMVYGIKVQPKGDPYLEIAEIAVTRGSEALLPGRWLVDILPILKYVPEWMPGAGFQRKAREYRGMVREMNEMPLQAVKDAMESGTVKPSIAAKLLEGLYRRADAPIDEEEIIGNVSAVSYAAGADTTVSALATFFLAMVLHPEVQHKAQMELDSVLGNRLPAFEDSDNLPYINAICKEIHRWYPAVPLGVAHRVMEDDVYEGYLIPAGSIVMANSWAMLRDEKVYGPNSDTFDPERFLRPGAVDPVEQFGFGRRVCPGRYMVANTIFIVVASILKVFNLSPSKDSDGNEIPPQPAYSKTLITHPEHFSCTIEPRSESARSLILNSVET